MDKSIKALELIAMQFLEEIRLPDNPMAQYSGEIISYR